jgi:hypothetical protein
MGKGIWHLEVDTIGCVPGLGDQGKLSQVAIEAVVLMIAFVFGFHQ